ncbi:hypothetical protein [Paramicrobacterium agarici]|uniref:hypothetical protein n=1 Tax=Paramicrobacterium agarici TaxID=630514 RepID=UPI001150E1A6|nr:hypothetical protein [Microbacterium agarici]TQO24267.1 hypothetical protein FB385_3147 [Microbacterium agarici]
MTATASIKLLLDADDTLTCVAPEYSPWPGEVRTLRIVDISGRGPFRRQYELYVAEELLIVLRAFLAGHPEVELQWRTTWSQSPIMLRDLANRLRLGIKAWRHDFRGDYLAQDELEWSRWKAETVLKVGAESDGIIWAYDQSFRYKDGVEELGGKGLVLAPGAGNGLAPDDVDQMHVFVAGVTDERCSSCPPM